MEQWAAGVLAYDSLTYHSLGLPLISMRIFNLTENRASIMLRHSEWCRSLFGSAISNQRRGLADEKAVKNRMKSVQSIQKVNITEDHLKIICVHFFYQITRAMKMVAASKLRYDQSRRDMGLPFCKSVLELFDRLPISETSSSSSMSRSSENRELLLVCLSSGRSID